jgi:hypothetical protein
MWNENYDIINSFNIENFMFLFYDIFCRNNEIILICPVYQTFFDEKMITLYFLDVKLNLKYVIKKIKHEPVVILIYEIICDSEYVNIDVIYNGTIKKSFNLYNMKTQGNTFFLSQTTLCKNDHNEITKFCHYYENQGVEFFFIYYNGKITEDIKKHESEKIKIIEWDYQYWLCEKIFPYIHHAQMGQMHHALYKYCKIFSEYTIFNDLDEYIYIPKTKISDFIHNKKYINYFAFLNCWSDYYLNHNIFNEMKIMVAKKKLKYKMRSKYITKNESALILGVHMPELPTLFLSYKKNDTNITNNIDKEVFIVNNGYLIHFYKLSGTKKTCKKCPNNLILDLPYI